MYKSYIDNLIHKINLRLLGFISILRKVFQNKIVRFLFCGGITAAFNVILIYILIEGLGLNTPVLRNFANVLAIEVSLIFTFFVYKIWVWSGGTWRLRDVLGREIPLFHISSGIAISLRSFLIFPIVDWLGVHYVINTLMGILIGSILNYFACDKIIFKK
ncbi:GtrA family protein [Coleofasciculus sp. G2-EDA-02]|uniref:GtrA family protein n=1 Tax=Coleofasciculus sp. G2-EDA-02 TaxID=3069529 RepID=UPI00330084CF